MPGMPQGPDEVTAQWLSTVTGWTVTDVQLTEIGAGIGVSSAVYRARLTGTGCPESVVVKLTAADPAAAFTCTVLSMYRREVAFFEQLADRAPMRVPQGYFGTVSEDGSQLAMVMEDLGGNRICDQIVGMAPHDAAVAVDALAAWHAQWWRDVNGLTDSGAAVALADPIYPAMLPGLFDEGWAKLTASTTCQPPDVLLGIGPRFSAALPTMLEALSQEPLTLVHGDFRADNILFTPDDELILLDFQLTGVGSAAYDLAYFVTQSIDQSVAGAHEAELFDRWKTGLVAGGVDEGDLGRMWEDYRMGALFCLVYPVVACRGMDLDKPRERALAVTMMGRMGRAAADLDLASLI